MLSALKMATSSSSSQEVAQKRPVPIQLRQVSSRKGKKYTQSELAAKKPRVELTFKQKNDIIKEANDKEIV